MTSYISIRFQIVLEYVKQHNDGGLMSPRKMDATCQTCGKRVEFTPCSRRRDPPEDVPCRVLGGWLTVHHWTGVGSIDQYDFCSFICLQRWVEAQVPKIPSTFLEAFTEEGKSKEETGE